jgi:hypothetical protein
LNLSTEFGAVFIPIFAMLIAIMVMGLSRPRSDRYLFFPFNGFQRGEVRTALKRVELVIRSYLPNLPCREVDAQRREGVARA